MHISKCENNVVIVVFLLSICCFGGVYLLFRECLVVSLFVKHLILADLRFKLRNNLLHLLHNSHIIVGV